MSQSAPPTERQLRYLRSLASRTETTFIPPSTRRDASQEIARLIALSRQAASTSDEAEEPEGSEHLYATAVHPDEVSGFGSTATWRSRPPASRTTTDLERGPIRLLTYRTRAAERVLLAERRGNRVYVTDAPAHGPGDRYPVEQLDSSEGLGSLRALVADYRARARELDDIPMAPSALAKTLSGAREDG